MSKILRRPMFRGGPVDSRGTGITSGLYAEGGAVETPKRGIVDGPGSYSYRNFTTGGELLNLDNSMGQGGQFDILNMKDFLGTSRNILDQQKDVEVGSDGDTIKKTVEDIFTEEKVKKDADEAKAKEMGVDVETMKAIEKENLSTSGVSDAIKEKNILTQKDLSTSNEPSSTVIDEKALIREQAELFKELLGEQNEKKLKDARISDASDYLLKFFEGSQKEGATVGSAAADVAGFATAKDSKTEKAKAQIEKGDQTATALAINDYIAGKRSKEATDQLITKLGLSAELKKGNVKEQIRDATVKLGGSPPLSVLQSILAADGPVEVITKEQVEAGYEPNQDGSDDGKYYLEEDTKTIYKVVGNKKVRL
jgi:hypothetical protein